MYTDTEIEMLCRAMQRDEYLERERVIFTEQTQRERDRYIKRKKGKIGYMHNKERYFYILRGIFTKSGETKCTTLGQRERERERDRYMHLQRDVLYFVHSFYTFRERELFT